MSNIIIRRNPNDLHEGGKEGYWISDTEEGGWWRITKSIAVVLIGKELNLGEEYKIKEAPNLLGVLEKIYAEAGVEGGLTWEYYEMARKAIEKAKGKDS